MSQLLNSQNNRWHQACWRRILSPETHLFCRDHRRRSHPGTSKSIETPLRTYLWIVVECEWTCMWFYSISLEDFQGGKGTGRNCDKLIICPTIVKNRISTVVSQYEAVCPNLGITSVISSLVVSMGTWLARSARACTNHSSVMGVKRKMIASVAPSVPQIKYYAQSALNGFGTLGLPVAVECVKCKLSDLLRYVGAFDNANNTVSVLWSGGVESRIVVESLVSKSETGE